ncbi:MAG: hypothetical protein ABSF34_02485, partial [Verrucomicrobiota bacterium]
PVLKSSGVLPFKAVDISTRQAAQMGPFSPVREVSPITERGMLKVAAKASSLLSPALDVTLPAAGFIQTRASLLLEPTRFYPVLTFGWA